MTKEEFAARLEAKLADYTDNGMINSVHGEGKAAEGYLMGFIDCIDDAVKLYEESISVEIDTSEEVEYEIKKYIFIKDQFPEKIGQVREYDPSIADNLDEVMIRFNPEIHLDQSKSYKIVGNNSGHGFLSGTVVSINYVDYDSGYGFSYSATASESGTSYWIVPSDVEEVKQ